MAPSYLPNLLACGMSSYSLRSVSKGDRIDPSSRTRTYGDRSFAVCGMCPKIVELVASCNTQKFFCCQF